MKFLRSIFSRKSADRQAAPDASSDVKPAAPSALVTPETIRVYDSYGRERLISREDWRNKVLLENLDARRNDPDALYDMLVTALKDGFAADILPYAVHLAGSDRIPSRGITLLGVTYMECNRLTEASDVLARFLAQHGDDGVVLTNLAKVQHRQGMKERSEQTLWRGLQADPNQDNGMAWYVAIQSERDGAGAAIEAYRRVAAIPGSWRAQLWLARDALDKRDLAGALSLYDEALSVAGTPAPVDLLMQISGDLGNHGYLAEIIRLISPRFDVDQHGLLVGNNLIKAYNDLGLLDEAREVLRELYARRRPDWQQTLGFWDGELARTAIARRPAADPHQLSVVMLMLAAPLWARDHSPFAALLPHKEENAPGVYFYGSVIVKAMPAEEGRAQLSDGPGRLSRVVPLALAEHVHMYSNVRASTLIPWVQTQGFAVFSKPHDDEDLLRVQDNAQREVDYVAGVTVEVRDAVWLLTVRLLRLKDQTCIGQWQRQIEGEPGDAVQRVINDVMICLGNEESISLQDAPDWYKPLSGPAFSNQLLRLEQQLAVFFNNTEEIDGPDLSGQHEILQGILHLCVDHPDSVLARILLGQTLRLMRKSSAEIVAEFAVKIARLEQAHRLDGAAGALVAETIRGQILEFLGH